MDNYVSFEEFRAVIEAMADLVCCHGFSTEEDGLLRAHLLEKGFEIETIRQAEAWCDRAQATGSLVDVLSAFVPSGNGTRLSSPLERVSVSDEVWDAISHCRRTGVISTDLAERLLEGARAMDTRDWDDDDVREFILDACAANGVPSVVAKMERALSGDLKVRYS
jgi:Protein of unknown function (DUF494)